MTVLYATFNFIGFLFSLLKGIYNTCAKHTQVNRQARVAHVLFAELFGLLSTSVSKILLDAQMSKYNIILFTKLNTCDTPPQEITNTTPTAPSHLHSLKITILYQ